MELKSYLQERNRDIYERDEFDSFLDKIRFSFDIPFIHVAGTNGKGSTCKYIYEILKDAGYKVGLFMSPCYNDPCQLIEVDGKLINENDFLNIINDNKKLIEKYDLSGFEIETFVAYTYFKKEKCDICVIECGMGGEIDATNIATPILSIITSISLEHTNALGKTVGEIALHKAGIIKREVPVLIPFDLRDDALNVIANVAKENNSPIYQSENYSFEKYADFGYTFSTRQYENLRINTPARYSLRDACFALSAVSIIKDKFPVNEENIRHGLNNMYLSGRMNVIDKNPLVIIDGGHNPEAIHQLVNEVECIQRGNVHIVFACFKDKNINIMLPELSILSKDLILTSFDHLRAREEGDYFLYLEEYKFNEDHQALIQDLLDNNPNDTVLICGSLAFAYLVKDEFDKGEYVFKDFKPDTI